MMKGIRTQSYLSLQHRKILTNLYNYPTSISVYDYLQIFHGASRNHLQGTPLYLSIARSLRNLNARGLITKSKDFHSVSYGLSPKGLEVVLLEV